MQVQLAAKWASECWVHRIGSRTPPARHLTPESKSLAFDLALGAEYVIWAQCMTQGLRSPLLKTGPVLSGDRIHVALPALPLRRVRLRVPAQITRVLVSSSPQVLGDEPNLNIIDQASVASPREAVELWAPSRAPIWLGLDGPKGRYWRRMQSWPAGHTLDVSTPDLVTLTVLGADKEPLEGACASLAREKTPFVSQPRALHSLALGWSDGNGRLAIDTRELPGRRLTAWAYGHASQSIVVPKARSIELDKLVLPVQEFSHRAVVSDSELNAGVADYAWRPRRRTPGPGALPAPGIRFVNGRFEATAPGRLWVYNSVGWEQSFSLPQEKAAEPIRGRLQVEAASELSQGRATFGRPGSLAKWFSITPSGAFAGLSPDRPLTLLNLKLRELPLQEMHIPPRYLAGPLVVTSDECATVAWQNRLAMRRTTTSASLKLGAVPAKRTRFRLLTTDGEPLPRGRIQIQLYQDRDTRQRWKTVNSRGQGVVLRSFWILTDESGVADVPIPSDWPYMYKADAPQVDTLSESGEITPGEDVVIRFADPAWLLIRTAKRSVNIVAGHRRLTLDHPYGGSERLVVGPLRPGPIVLEGSELDPLRAGEVRELEL
jgi:hypothetical protein